MKKPRFREINTLAQGHIGRNSQISDSSQPACFRAQVHQRNPSKTQDPFCNRAVRGNSLRVRLHAWRRDTERGMGMVSQAQNRVGFGWGLGTGRLGSKPFCLGMSRLPRRKGIQAVSCRKNRSMRGGKVGLGHSKSFQAIPGQGSSRSKGLEADTGWY